MRKIIRTDGTEEVLDQPKSLTKLKELIGANTVDTVLMRHMGHPVHVMLVDDTGYNKGLPVNEKATALYHANCIPGTTHKILGDVAIIPDADFS